MNVTNRLLSLLLGLTLIAGGLLAAVEAVIHAFGGDPLVVPIQDWPRTLRQTPLSATVPRIVFALAVAAGLVLLFFEVRRRPSRRAALLAGPGTWWVLRRSAERGIRHDLLTETPTRNASARLVPKAGGWQLRIHADARDDVKPVIEQRAKQFLGRLGAPEGSTVRARVHSSRRAD